MAATRAQRRSALPESGTYAARRFFTLRDRSYTRGEVVDTSELEDWKVAQLVAQRYLELVSQPDRAVAARPFDWRGTSFTPGDEFPLAGITPEKRAQLFEHRYIQPIPAIA